MSQRRDSTCRGTSARGTAADIAAIALEAGEDAAISAAVAQIAIKFEQSLAPSSQFWRLRAHARGDAVGAEASPPAKVAGRTPRRLREDAELSSDSSAQADPTSECDDPLPPDGASPLPRKPSAARRPASTVHRVNRKRKANPKPKRATVRKAKRASTRKAPGKRATKQSNVARGAGGRKKSGASRLTKGRRGGGGRLIGLGEKWD